MDGVERSTRQTSTISADSARGPFRTDGRKVDRLTRREEAERAEEAWQAIVDALYCGCDVESSRDCMAGSAEEDFETGDCACRCHRGGRS